MYWLLTGAADSAPAAHHTACDFFFHNTTNVGPATAPHYNNIYAGAPCA